MTYYHNDSVNYVCLCACVYRTIKEYMNEEVKYVITQEEWDDNFDKVRIK